MMLGPALRAKHRISTKLMVGHNDKLSITATEAQIHDNIFVLKRKTVIH